MLERTFSVTTTMQQMKKIMLTLGFSAPVFLETRSMIHLNQNQIKLKLKVKIPLQIQINRRSLKITLYLKALFLERRTNLRQLHFSNLILCSVQLLSLVLKINNLLSRAVTFSATIYLKMRTKSLKLNQTKHLILCLVVQLCSIISPRRLLKIKMQASSRVLMPL